MRSGSMVFPEASVLVVGMGAALEEVEKAVAVEAVAKAKRAETSFMVRFEKRCTVIDLL